jgi:TPR repeat protein
MLPAWIGDAYYYGEQGCRKNVEEAVSFWRRASDKGHADAQCKLGLCYAEGEGVEQSWEQAVELYRRASEQGFAGAQNNLGWYYASGKGVEQSWEQAVELFRRASDQGNAHAQTSLAVCFEEGNGVEQNLDQAKRLFKQAANKGHDNDAPLEALLGVARLTTNRILRLRCLRKAVDHPDFKSDLSAGQQSAITAQLALAATDFSPCSNQDACGRLESKVPEFKVCAGCKPGGVLVWYCSTACQAADWSSRHKGECKRRGTSSRARSKSRRQRRA